MSMRFLLLLTTLLIVPIASAQGRETRSKCEAGVGNHIKDKFAQDKTYLGFTFKEFETFKPREYQELEELIEVKKTLPDLKDHYKRKKLDSLININAAAIQAKKQEIIDKRLHFSYKIVHTFALKDGKNEIKAYEYTFFLNHAYKVKDVRLSYTIDLSKDQAEDYYYFQRRLPLFNRLDERKNNKASAEIYDFFEKGIKDSAYDKDIIYSALRITHNVKTLGYLELDSYGQNAIAEWIAVNKTDIDGYKAQDYSYFMEIKSEDEKETLGYKMFHKYTYKEDGKKETDVVYFEFDRYFTIRGLMRVAPPYEQHFEKE